MFRNYVKESLDLNEYNKILKNAPDGQKYCNAFCQKFMDETEFYENRANCKICFNQILKARKMIDSNQITIEQFKNNPSLVVREKPDIPVFRNCKTCELDLSLDKFEAYRKECIQCRKKKKKINYQEEFETKCVVAIESAKTDIPTLTNIIKGMSADLLKLAVKHYQISMPSDERVKDKLVVHIIDYFKSLLNPFICLGHCGNTLSEQFSVCDVCKTNKKTIAEEKLIEFEKNIDELIPTLTSMKKEDSHLYNKKQIMMIATKLGIKYYKTQDKPVIMELIDKHLEDKLKEETRIAMNNIGGEINLNGITVLSREDGFINATALCKAGGKKFNDWYRLESTAEIIKVLTENLNAENPVFKNLMAGIPDIKNFEVIEITKGKYGGSWIHPDLAVQLAQWISPMFALQISKWIRELSIYGTVTLGKEKLLELQNENKQLKNENWKLKQKKQYHKFKKGPSFYIISDLDGKSVKFKPGFEGVDVFTRMQQHRSTMPGCRIEYLIYSNDSDLVEKAVLKRFESKRKIVNHEWIFDVDVDYIKKSTRTILDVLNIDYIEETDLEEYNEQIKTDFE
jgi:hypothetical protein